MPTDSTLIRNVVSRFMQSGSRPEYEVRVQVTGVAADSLPNLLIKIHKLGRGGHSFGIQSDDKESLGGWDGDGGAYITNIRVVDLQTGEEKDIDPDE
jgi:hypothetical protein